MKKSQWAVGFLFFAAATLIGFSVGKKTWRGTVYLTDGTLGNQVGNDRTPAAIKRELDFSKLDGAELLSATQKRLVTDARAIIHEGSVGIELGHFVTRDEDGQRRLACDSVYNRLTLEFAGEGVATAGEKPEMSVDAPCAVAKENLASIAPVWIPVAEVVKETASSDWQRSYGDGVNIQFSHMVGAWPMEWSLRSVRLYHTAQPEAQLSINESELRELREKPFKMNWFEAIGNRGPAAVIPSRETN